MIKLTLFATFVFAATGCAITRAPTDYELDRRSGLALPTDDDKNDLKSTKVETTSSLPKSATMPARLPPIVERIWVTDKRIGSGWLQGTWLWVEVENGKWLMDVDPGGASIFTEPQTQKFPGVKN